MARSLKAPTVEDLRQRGLDAFKRIKRWVSREERGWLEAVERWIAKPDADTALRGIINEHEDPTG